MKNVWALANLFTEKNRMTLKIPVQSASWQYLRRWYNQLSVSQADGSVGGREDQPALLQRHQRGDLTPFTSYCAVHAQHEEERLTGRLTGRGVHTTDNCSGWGLLYRKWINAEKMDYQRLVRDRCSQYPKMGIRVYLLLGLDQQVSGLISHRVLFFPKHTLYRNSTSARGKKQAPLVEECGEVELGDISVPTTPCPPTPPQEDWGLRAVRKSPRWIEELRASWLNATLITKQVDSIKHKEAGKIFINNLQQWQEEFTRPEK